MAVNKKKAAGRKTKTPAKSKKAGKKVLPAVRKKKKSNKKKTVPLVKGHGQPMKKLLPAEPVGIGIRRILAEEVERIDGFLLQYEHEPHTLIHETRRILKRIRAVIWLMEPDIGIYNCQREAAVYRDIGRRISLLRSLYVNQETLEKLKKELPQKFGGGPLERIAQSLKKQYESKLQEALVKENLMVVLRKDIEEAKSNLENLPVMHDDLEIPAHALRDSFRAGRKCWRKVARKANSINIHDLRKETKNLLFQLQMFEQFDPKGIHRRIEPLHRLAQLCGAEHDHYELLLFIRKYLPQEALKKELMFRINKKMTVYRKQILPLSRKIFGTKSKRFIASIHLNVPGSESAIAAKPVDSR